LRFLSGYAFPGNVRELENLLHRALALSSGQMIERADLGLPDTLAGVAEAAGSPAAASGPASTSAASAAAPVMRPAVPAPLPSDLVAHLDAVERDILERALNEHRYNRTAAGASLGLSLRQMRYRMARLGIGSGDSSERNESAG
jgi:two-component system response regulator PilR (NtrC family)